MSLVRRSSPRTRRLLSVAGALAATALVLTGCSSANGSGVSSDGSAKLKLVLEWYPDPESGGFYAARSTGLYDKAGLDVSIQPGGPNVSATQIVAGGRAQIGLAEAPALAQARADGIPVVAIGAMYQTNPAGVMVHADSGMKKIEDTAGRTWVVSTGQVGPDWVKQKYGIGFKTQAYSGSIANFLKNDGLVQQGWPTSEQYQAGKQGVRTTFFSYADTGYNPYGDVIFTTESFLKEHPDQVKAFLKSSMQGWADYMSDLKVARTAQAAMRKANKEESSEVMWYAWQEQRTFITSHEGAGQLGAMTKERWSTLLSQLRKVGALKKTVDVDDLYDSSYLPDIEAPASLPKAPDGSF
ncbi:ABC transporter substrate-binding protein [Streptomyces sp. NPDC047000]|uniref:ABC transporter substrate-binding protein n=1 Tax=Streptomyces sp. NPDC047000 TaxID=3155474 RepID=UPI0033E9FAE6